MKKNVKILFLWTKTKLLKMFICNGRPDNDITKEDIFRTRFKKNGKDDIASRDDGVRGSGMV